MKGDGDCYMVAACLVTSPHAHPTAMLCHGTCTGHGPIEGVAFGHAWVEFQPFDEASGFVIVVEQSNDHDATIDRDIYYEAGECRNVVRYTVAEALAMMLEHGHYGPWHVAPEDEA